MGHRRRLWFLLAGLVLLWAAFRASGLDSHFSVEYLHQRFVEHKLGGFLVFTALFALGSRISSAP